MWKCANCQLDDIKDKFKHCWNCGSPKPTTAESEIRSKKVEEPSKVVVETPAPVKIEPMVEEQPKISVVEEKVEPKSYIQDEFLSGYKGEIKESSNSIFSIIIPVLLWLIVTGAVAYFAYLSNQKTTAFDNQILTDAQNFNTQKANFSFPQTALPDRRNQYKIEGNIKGKVLPLNKATGEVAELFYYLPDDLRATNSDDAKTFFYVDCQNEQVGKFPDGSTGYRERCNTYLVDREAGKFIGVQDFQGISPAFTKKTGTGDEVGKVLPDRYITYLREKQIETERGQMKYPSDSPNHHYFNKSEFYLAVGLLSMLGAIGLGWSVFRIKSALNAD